MLQTEHPVVKFHFDTAESEQIVMIFVDSYELVMNTVSPNIFLKIGRIGGRVSLNLLAVHLESSGRGTLNIANRLNDIHTLSNLIVAGDFNFDLRRQDKKNVKLKTQLTTHAKVREVFDNSEGAFPSLEYASCNKCRSPFQAQSTKMLIPDFDLKDYIAVGRDFEIDGEYKGVLDVATRVPTDQFPSDHALISATISMREKPQEKRKSTITTFLAEEVQSQSPPVKPSPRITKMITEPARQPVIQGTVGLGEGLRGLLDWWNYDENVETDDEEAMKERARGDA